jgi:hypothetical protein
MGKFWNILKEKFSGISNKTAPDMGSMVGERTRMEMC